MMRTKRTLAILQRTFVLVLLLAASTVFAYAKTSTWNGMTPSSQDQTTITGTGRDDDPYIINSADDFAYFCSKMKGDVHCWQIAEELEVIDLNNQEWRHGVASSGGYNFFGVFDGNGCVIKNLKISNYSSANTVALFPVISGSKNGGKLMNLAVEHATVYMKNWPLTTNGSAVAVLVAYVEKNAEIKTCRVSDCTIYVGGTMGGWNSTHSFGALVGVVYDDSSITDCKAEKIKFCHEDTDNAWGSVDGGSNAFGAIAGRIMGGKSMQPKVKDVAVKDLTVDMYLTQKTKNQGVYTVGGAFGTVTQPCANMPENVLVYNCKINAPMAAVGPVAAFFGPQPNNNGWGQGVNITKEYGSGGYSGEGMSISSDNLAKKGTWMYNGYQLGVIDQYITEATKAGYRTNPANLATSGLLKGTLKGPGGLTGKWFEVGDATQTMPRTNSDDNKSYSSRTLFWYTANDGSQTMTENQQSIPNPSIDNWGDSRADYWSYFMQGYNGGSYVYEEVADGFYNSIAKVKKLSVVTLKDENLGQRGKGKHKIVVSVKAGSDGGKKWRWYVDGVEKTQDFTDVDYLEVEPDYAKARSVTVMTNDSVVRSYTLHKALLPTKYPEAAKYETRGTDYNPYIISTDEELRLWSEYSRLTGKVVNAITEEGKEIEDDAEHFNTAWFELGADIKLAEENFTPICALEAKTYDQQHTFRGQFNGRGHVISNMQQLWRGGDLPFEFAEMATQSWGLFGVVGGGEAKAKIQNLIIKDAVLTHDKNDKSFLYGEVVAKDKNTNGQGTNCAVGVLAGMVTNNSVIQNIDCQNCKITDEGSEKYINGVDRWQYWLWVGGVIGRVQQSYKNFNGDIANTVTLRYLSAQTDIDIRNSVIPVNASYGINRLQITPNSSYADYDGNKHRGVIANIRINAGGIVGSMWSSTAANSLSWPKHTYYAGSMLVNQAFAGPAFGIAHYSGLNIDKIDDWHKQWTGEKDVLSTTYYSENKFKLGTTRNNYKEYGVNDLLESKCGDSTIIKHANSGTPSASDYRGHFVGTSSSIKKNADDATDVVEEFDHNYNDDEDMTYKWGWDADGERPILTSQSVTYLKAEISDDNSKVWASMHGSEPTDYSYSWYNKCNQVVQESTGDIAKDTICGVYQKNSLHDQYFYCVAEKGTYGEVGYVKYISKAIIIKGTLEKVTAEVKKDEPEHVSGGTYTYEEYKNEKISQAEYFSLSEDIRIKTPAVLYESWNEYNKDCKEKGVVDSLIISEAAWNDSVNNSAHIKIPAEYYLYSEFIKLEKEDNKIPYIYKHYNNETKQLITEKEFNALSNDEKTKKAKIKYKLTVELTPTAKKLTEAGYTVTYVWQTATGESAGNESSLELEAEEGGAMSRYCVVTVSDDECGQSKTVFSEKLEGIFGRTPIYLCPNDCSNAIDKDGKKITSVVNGITSNGYRQGSDYNDGKTPETAVQSWSKAYSLLEENGSWNSNLIVLMGVSYKDQTNSVFGLGNTGNQGNSTTDSYEKWWNRAVAASANRNVTISGKDDNGVDYGAVLQIDNQNGKNLSIFGDTRFENLTISNNGNSYSIINAQYYNLEMGEGLIMKNFGLANSNVGQNGLDVGPLPGTIIADLQIFAGCNNDARFNNMAGGSANFEIYMPHPEGFSITVKSGFYSNICSAGRQCVNDGQTGMTGSPNAPIRCTVNIDIDREWNDKHNEVRSGNYATYDVGAVMAGNHEGSMMGNVNLNIYGGIIGRITSGSLGYLRGAQNCGQTGSYSNNKAYYGINVSFPFDSFYGMVDILLDPAKSESNKNMTDVNKRLVVGELYGGALGRVYDGDKNRGYCMSTFYGKNTITINGGTFDLNTNLEGKNNGKGKYGLNAYNNSTFKVNDKTFYYAQPGIYGAGAGGFNGIGDDNLHTNDNRLPYWVTANDDHKVVMYGDYDEYKKHTGDDKVYIKCVDKLGNEYSIDPAETSTTMTINGGVFFPDEKSIPLDQVCGIFGAGNGYVNKALLNTDNNRMPNPLAGCLLAGEGKTASTININGGTFFRGVYGGGKGNDVYYKLRNIASDSYNGVTYGGSDQYKSNGRVYGNVVMNIKGGTFYGNIYGSGCGSESVFTNECPELASVIGSTTINIDSVAAHIYGNVYGGGEYALTTNNTEVNINAGNLYGDVFGGGDLAIVGQEKTEEVPVYDEEGNNTNNKETVTYGTGKASVNTNTANAIVYGDVYGGGKEAQIFGNTYVTMSAGKIAGEIYGGGQGKVSENAKENRSADIHGDTYVYLNGYEVLWNKMYDKTTPNVNDTKVGTVIEWNGSDSDNNYGKFIDSKTGTKPKWRASHNVYAGGKTACIIDSTAQVTVTRGMTPLSLLKTNAWKQSYYDNDNPHFYVFGGGYGEKTVAKNSKVNVGLEGFIIEDATTDDALSKDGGLFVVDKDGEVVNTFGDDINIGIYSNAYGIANYTVLGVLGGGYMGTITNNADVTVGGSTFMHRVYGGGYGDPRRESASTTSDLGKVGNNTKVTANGGYVNGDVFGGGARAEVGNTTTVEILRNTKVYGSVYGGGDVANVSNRTEQNVNDTVASVTVGGGIIYKNVFAGGSKGSIHGSTLVNVKDSVFGTTATSPYIYGDVFGGCEEANVDGHTYVTIDGGSLAGDIFGGGLGNVNKNDEVLSHADVKKNTNVAINGGTMLWGERCVDYTHGTVFFFDNSSKIALADFLKGEATGVYEEKDTIGALGFFDWSKGRFFVDHNIYGGGKYACSVDSARITMKHGMVTSGLEPYDSEVLPLFSVCWYKVIMNQSYPQFSLIGGGYGKNTTVANTDVRMLCATDDKYAAYDEDRQTIGLMEYEVQARWKEIADNIKESIYGGINENAFRRYRASRYAWSGGIKNHVVAHVVGGSWAGKVTGNTNVTMDGSSGCRNVFGGGVGQASDEKLGEVAGTANVNINNAIVSGSVFGGGAGIESADKNYVNVARVLGGTNVVVNGNVYDEENTAYPTSSNEYVNDGTMIFGSVYGGGDVANVGAYNFNTDADPKNTDNDKYITNVNVKGGLVFSQVYGGGNGRKQTECSGENGYKTVGAVYGNTYVKVSETDAKFAPWIWNSVYGGGQCGTVYGNSNVDILGGHHGYDIYGGGLGIVDTLENNSVVLTDAGVTGNTHVNIGGGEWVLSQIWQLNDSLGNVSRTWLPSHSYKGEIYSAQYNPVAKTFIINHNVYGGGNICSTVGGASHVNVTKGMVFDNTLIGRKYEAGTNTIFEQREWKEIYDKIGSAHFSVFGGGYGANTNVAGDTYVDVNIEGQAEPSATYENEGTPAYLRFKDKQSLLDVIGGGYLGTINGNSNVHIGGNTFMRRCFGGGYYASVKNSKVYATSGDIDEIFAGGLLGDVDESTYTDIGQHDSIIFDAKVYSKANDKLFINKNIYGGNDVSGTIGYKDEKHVEGQGSHVNLLGGNIYGNVYGGGNGDYLYALGVNNEKMVTPNENYLKTDEFEGYSLVYTVPMRPGMMSSSHASNAQKIVNIASYRPLTIESNVTLSGQSESEVLFVKGNVYGGGNAATVDAAGEKAAVKIDIRNHIKVGGVFLGSDGDALFMDSEKNPFLSNFQSINNINLEDTVVWDTDPSNRSISTKWLPVEHADRYKVYPHLLDLYFKPVEMSVQPVVLWNGEKDGKSLTNAEIGVFCCGGNRGNMNVYPNAKGNAVDIVFPKGLTIRDYIIGGCNNANYTWHNSATGNITTHVGGYLLGNRATEEPMIRMVVDNKFKPAFSDEDGEYHGGNVYGGCYKSGNINGDVCVDVRSNMLEGLNAKSFDKIKNIGNSACNVFGAGYGLDSYVYGNVSVLMGKDTKCKTNTKTEITGAGSKPAFDTVVNADTLVSFNDLGTSANYVFGGGLQGNVIGNTTVKILNGHVRHSVTGGSYAGYQWGSTQVLVGYPEYYVVKEQNVYNVKRKDENEKNLAFKTQDVNGNESQAIKQTVNLMAGDIISKTLYESIVEANSSYASNFDKVEATSPTVGWDDVAITIDDAVYGGGYSLASGSSQMANNTIVLKYDGKKNLDDATTQRSTVGYGGNTTIVVWDKVDYDGSGFTSTIADNAVDHVSISKQEMVKVDLKDGEDMFGYYYKDQNGHYHYIYQEKTYYAGQDKPKPSGYDGTYMTAYSFDAEGGMYGDGHLSFAEGFRTGELQGYGYNGGLTADGARIMNSFQRMDILRLTDCNVVMLGARDYATNATNTTPYSIARVGELQMVSNIDDSKKLLAVKDLKFGQQNPVEDETKQVEDVGNKGARNFLGLSNNILYVGCVYTNTKFDDKWHDSQLAKGEKSYKEIKQGYINRYYGDGTDNGNKEIFQKRNEGTSKNMIGVSSGYAMKIQNVSSKKVEKALVDTAFYGPIVGIAEVNLMSARMDEGGGYIYADNIHKRTNGEKEDFLMTTGNFVFAHNTQDAPYIMDDCYVNTYDQSVQSSKPLDVAHYWYIEGFNYFYQIHITGYTADSDEDPMYFESDNTDLFTILRGAKKGQKVTLHSVNWRSNHFGSDHTFDECDIDGFKKNPDGSLDKTQPRMDNDHYRLSLSASGDIGYMNNPDLGVFVDSINRGVFTTEKRVLDGEIKNDEPIISMQLMDKVDNRTTEYYKKHLSEQCLSTIVLTVPALDDKNEPLYRYLGVDALFTYDDSKQNYVNIGTGKTVDLTGATKYYYYSSDTRSYEELDKKKLFYSKTSTGTSGDSDTEYVKITSLKTDNDGLFVWNSETSGNQKVLYHTTRDYTYTLYLTIDYVQGPEIKGHITIENCALPGEMIRLTTDSVDIVADESMAPTGYFWRIGMREQNADGTWSFCDKTPWERTTVAAGYDSYQVQDDNDESMKHGVFKGCLYNADDNTLDIPAYYFMNGYGIQFGVTFNGMGYDNIYPLQMITADSLTVHNFHLARPSDIDSEGTDAINLYLGKAAARAKAYKEYIAYKAEYDKLSDEEKKDTESHPAPVYVAPLNEPRVYINDERDLWAFYNIVDTVGTKQTEVQLGVKKYEIPKGGKYMQFYQTDNIKFEKFHYHTPKAAFAGLYDGMGHVIDMSDGSHTKDAPTFFGTLDGKVYNLGVYVKPMADKLGENGEIHNSFTYGGSATSPVCCVNDKTVNTSKLDNCFDLSVASENDFVYGKVAYDLNKFYLEERYRRGTEGDEADGYIENFYKNGEYQYMRRKDSYTGQESGVVYLRTTNNMRPYYGNHQTRHDMKHSIDKYRAVKTYYTAEEATAYNKLYNEEYAYDIKKNPAQYKADPVKEGDLKSVTYKPLFNENALSGINLEGADTLKNDYILFGQVLGEKTSKYPVSAASRLLSQNTNRVWRASGFYGSKKDEGFYFNALKGVTTYAADSRLTAIDFSCLRDGAVTANSYQKGMSSVTGYPTEFQSVYYAPCQDLPSTGLEDNSFFGFDVSDDVTKNLLVYSKSNTNINTRVAQNLDYHVDTEENLIKGHRVLVTGTSAMDAVCTAELMHLVDKQNFNAPIDFTATTAMYIRKPEFETGYVEQSGASWENICLPYTVQKVKLLQYDDNDKLMEGGINQYYDYKDELEDPEHKRGTLKETKKFITFFYGSADNKDDNPNILGHEFWLREMTGVENSDYTNDKLAATFKRPASSLEDGGMKAYTPYIVSFPGNRFYEFDMTGQVMTFNAANAQVNVTDDAVETNKVGVYQYANTNYTYYGSFVKSEVSSDKFAIALNEKGETTSTATGEKFNDFTVVYPFRGYIKATSTAGSKPAMDFTEESHEILISGLGIGLEDKGIEDPEEVIEVNGIKIYPSGKRIVVESTYATTLNVYSGSGQLVRILDVTPGTSTYSGFAAGIYVVADKKLQLK